jgi:hypothetical protein
MNKELIWYRDILNFITPANMLNILPVQSFTLEQKLNAITRFFIYLGVILALLRRDARYLMFGVLAAAIVYPIYEFEQKERVRAETFLKKNNLAFVNEKPCTATQIENPFMNPTIADIQYNPQRPEACPPSEAVDENFNERVFKDVTDIWGKDYSAREFYTVPNTTIPNKQGELAEWLYGTGATCKEGNGVECDIKNYRYILR